MGNRKMLLFFFSLVALAQVLVPAKMIFDREEVLESGTAFKFRTAPIDPSDPFRGRYITLNYLDNTQEVRDNGYWADRETLFVTFYKDDNGFARIFSISKEEPSGTKDYLKTTLSLMDPDEMDRDVTLLLNYPFQRFYMGEFKAKDAEKAYNRSLQDSSGVTYALVMIKEGEAVLKDVLIGGISIEEIVREEQLNKN